MAARRGSRWRGAEGTEAALQPRNRRPLVRPAGDAHQGTDDDGKPVVELSFDWPVSMGWTRGKHQREGNESGERERIPMPTSIVISW